MDIKCIKETVAKCNDYTTAEIIYKSKPGSLITRTCFLDPFDNALQLSSFEDIPDTYREGYEERYPELPCLSVALSLDRNHTADMQPKLHLPPRNIISIDLLTLYLGEEGGDRLSNSVQIRTENPPWGYQTVLGYLVDEGDLQRVLKKEEIPQIRIASFLKDGETKKIHTVDPVIHIFALIRNK